MVPPAAHEGEAEGGIQPLYWGQKGGDRDRSHPNAANHRFGSEERRKVQRNEQEGTEPHKETVFFWLRSCSAML